MQPLVNDPQWRELLTLATQTREKAYCPYSHYRVGAALRDARGKVFCGTNVENVSFGAAICAERSAVCQMVSDGGRHVTRIAVATADGGFPCGICLQVLLEFNLPDDEMQVALVAEDNKEVRIFKFSELLPKAFSTFRP